MATAVVLPQLGESIVEGTIDRWLKRVGDWVDRYEPLVEIITDKVNVELPSPVSGYLTEILVPEGTTVPVGTALASVEEIMAAAERLEPTTAAASVTAPSPSVSGGRARATPRVRLLARKHGIDLAQVQGTGPGGRIMERDVMAFAQGPVAKDEEEIPLTPVRRTIAQRLVHSIGSVPHAWLMMEADVTSLVRLRESVKEDFQRRYGSELTYLPFAIKAVTEALRQHPRLNASWAERVIVVKRRIHISVAVATDYGLVVPVIRDADTKSIADLTLALNDLSQRARASRLTLADVQGGTFTINNTGALGSIVSQPIINEPQAAILTTEAIVKRPVVVADDAIAIRSLMNIGLTFDHRVLDGDAAASFLRAVKERLEAMGPGMAID